MLKNTNDKQFFNFSKFTKILLFLGIFFAGFGIGAYIFKEVSSLSYSFVSLLIIGLLGFAWFFLKIIQWVSSFIFRWLTNLKVIFNNDANVRLIFLSVLSIYIILAFLPSYPSISLVLFLLLLPLNFIYFTYSKNVSLPLISPWITRKYFEIKFKLTDINTFFDLDIFRDHPEWMPGEQKLRKRKLLFRHKMNRLHKLFGYHSNTYLKIERSFLKSKLRFFYLFSLLFGSRDESFATTREELQSSTRKNLQFKDDEGKMVNYESITKQVKYNKRIELDILSEFNFRLFQLHKRTKQKLARLSMSGLASVVAFILLVTMILPYLFPIKYSFAATYTWTQNGWGGIASTTSYANHTNDQTGWINYYSQDGNLTVGSTLSLKVATGSDTFDSDADFASWASSSALISGSGNGALLELSSTTKVSEATISSHGYHTCAVNEAGFVFCWGSNNFGQLGNGNVEYQNVSPVKVLKGEAVMGDYTGNYLSNIKSISSSEHYSCAVSNAGNAYCWGFNNSGNLGNNSYSVSYTPVRVVKGSAADGDYSGNYLSNISSISTGYLSTCAVSNAGNVYCWGSNSTGSLGDASYVDKAYPVRVLKGAAATGDYNGNYLSNIKSVSDSGDYLGGYVRTVCAVSNAGNLYCWGSNNFGQLGDGTTSDSSTTARVLKGAAAAGDYDSSYLANVKSVSAGGHVCAVTNNDNTYCWGYNSYGQLGDGTTVNSTTTVQVLKGQAVAGDYAGSYISSTSQVVTGQNHTCALTKNDNLYCWGYNSMGQLGDGSYNNTSSPVHVVKSTAESGDYSGNYLSNIKTFSVDNYVTCSISNNNNIYCWGYGSYTGNINLGYFAKVAKEYIPENEYSGAYISDVDSFNVGYENTCIVKDGGVYCWGNNEYGQLGNNSTTTLIKQQVRILKGEAVEGDYNGNYLSNVLYISMGEHSGCALTNSGNVYCWGRNNYGQLGNNNTTDNYVPVRVLKGEAVSGDFSGNYLSNIKTLMVGNDTVFAISNNGNLYGWGNGNSGQLGIGVDQNKSTPVRTLKGEAAEGDYSGSYLNNIKSVSTDYNTTCSISNNGNVYCWGAGTQGNLGNNAIQNSKTPVRVLKGEAVEGDYSGEYLASTTNISVGSYRVCVTTNSNNGYCWGQNWGGLGNGSTTQQYSSVPNRIVKGEAVEGDYSGNYLSNIKSVNTANNISVVTNSGNIYYLNVNAKRFVKGSALIGDQDGTYLSNIDYVLGNYNTYCGLSNNNNLYCWGDNYYGQLGDGSNNSSGRVPARPRDLELDPSNDFLYAGTSYFPSGYFTSDVIDMGQMSGVAIPTYNGTTPTSTAIVIDARGGNTDTPDGSWSDWVSDIAGSDNIEDLVSYRYIQYKVKFSTYASAKTPNIDNITFNYQYYPTEGSLISSPFNSLSDSNALANITWTRTLPVAETSVKFQLQTAPDNSGAPGAWSGWMGPDGTDTTFFTDNSGNTMPAAFNGGNNDQWFQYKAILGTTDTSFTPTLSGVVMTYSVNGPPEFDATYGSNGVAVEQVSTSTDPFYNKVKIEYSILDSDTVTGTFSPNYITPTFKYSLDGGGTWIDINNNNVTFGDAPAQGDVANVFGDAKMENKVLPGSYLTYAAYWDAKAQIPNNYLTDALVKVTIQDNEACNNNVVATSTTFTLDTKDPAQGTPPIFINSIEGENNITLSATDDNGVKMRIGKAADLSDATWEDYVASKTVAIISDPDTVYVQFRDYYGNATAIIPATTPETPTSTMIQDTSNMILDPAEYRLFIAWKKVADPAPGFGSYVVYRAEDGTGPWTDVVGTVTNRNTNYYGDSPISSSTVYYYKVGTVDANGNVSYLSNTVSGRANGILDAGEGGGIPGAAAPIISNVSTSTVFTTQATIVWDTDNPSDSSVGYTTSAGGDFTSVPYFGSATLANNALGLGQHSITLTNLTPATTYYYTVRSTDVQGLTGSSTQGIDGYSFTTLSGPTISNVSSSSIENTNATISWTTDQAADSHVYYSTSSSMLSPTEIASAGSVTDHIVNITGLISGTKYYFYVTSDTATDNNSGDYYSFTTTIDNTGPAITFDPATGIFNIASSSATISWTTDELATSTIYYGLTANSYTWKMINDNLNTDHSFILNGLATSTTYYFKLANTDQNDNSSSDDNSGADYSFTTTIDSGLPDTSSPIISSINATSISDDSANITWITDEGATSQVQYGTVSGSYSSSTVLNANLNKNHSVALSGLLNTTKYYYIVISRDASSNYSTSTEMDFTTLETLYTETEVEERESTARTQGETTGRSSAGGGGMVTVIVEKIVEKIVDTSAQLTEELKKEKDKLAQALAENVKLLAKIKQLEEKQAQMQELINEQKVQDIEALSIMQQSTDETEKENILMNAAKKAIDIISAASNKVTITAYENTLNYQFNSLEKLAESVPSPILSGEPKVVTTANTATVAWRTDKDSNSMVGFSSEADYGIENKYLQSIGEANDRTKNHMVTIMNLKPDTVYHYQVRSKAPVGPESKSNDFVFQTQKEALDISSYAVQNISNEKAIFKWVSNMETDASIKYTPYRNNVLALDEVKNKYDKSVSLIHEMTVEDFEAGTVYQIELSGKNTKGQETSKTIPTFTTSKDDLPPVIYQVKSDSAIFPGKNDSVQTIISWLTNEPATSKVYYTEGVGNEENLLDKTSHADKNFSKKHVLVITKFEPGMIYRFQVESTDSNGNTSLSKVYTVLTPRQQETVFDVIKKNFIDLFGWTSRLGM